MKDNTSDIYWVELLSWPLVLAVPVSHMLLREKAMRRIIKVGELEGRRFLLFSGYEYPTVWQQVVVYFKWSRVNVKVVGEFDGIVSMSLALEAELGVALVPVNIKLSDKVRMVKQKPFPIPVCVAVGRSFHKGLSPTQAVLVEELSKASNQ